MSRTTLIGAALVALVPLTALTAPAATAGESAADSRLAPAYKVTAKVNKTTVVAKEDVIVVRGRVTPKAAGQIVILQQRVRNKARWTQSGTAKVKATGAYVLKDDPSTSGERQYRVVKPAGNGLAKGMSAPMGVTVFAWSRLAHWTRGANLGVDVEGVYVATDSMYPSLVTATPGSPGFVEYTLGSKCTALRATYALTDQSATGASGSVSVFTDGTNRLAQGLTVGQIVRDHVIDLTDVFRLRIELSSSATPEGHATLATPEVLCR